MGRFSWIYLLYLCFFFLYLWIYNSYLTLTCQQKKKGVILLFSSLSEQNQHIWSPSLPFSPCLSLLLGLLFKIKWSSRGLGGGGGDVWWRGCDWKIGSLFEWLAFTIMNLIWMEVHIKPHRFCTVILLIATEASLFVVLTPIQLKSHLEGNRLGSVNFMWKTPCD